MLWYGAPQLILGSVGSIGTKHVKMSIPGHQVIRSHDSKVFLHPPGARTEEAQPTYSPKDGGSRSVSWPAEPLSAVDHLSETAANPDIAASEDLDISLDQNTLPPERFARQIRTVGSMIDEVLLKRTQLRHESQMLESHRSQYHVALLSLMSTMNVGLTSRRTKKAKPADHQRPGASSRSHEEASRDGAHRLSRNASPGRPALTESHPQPNFGAAKTTMPYGLGSHQGQSHAIESRRGSPNQRFLSREPVDLLSTDSSFPSRGRTADSLAEENPHHLRNDQHLQTSQSRSFDSYYRDYQALCQQENLIKERTDDLSNLEFLLTERLTMVLKAMRSRDLAHNLRTEMLDENLSISEIISPTTSLGDMPPLLASYYSRRGDVGIIVERMQDLEDTHEEGREARAFLEDRGEPLEVAEDEFERNHQARKRQLEQELETLQAEAALLKRQCEDEGIDTDARRVADLSLYTGSAELASRNELDSDSGFQKIRDVRYEPAHRSGLAAAPLQRIGGWLDAMVLEDPHEPLTHPYMDSPGSPLSRTSAQDT